MPAEKKKIRPLDAKFIDMQEPHEVRYWTRVLGLSEEQLTQLVKEVGTSVESVKRKLAR